MCALISGGHCNLVAPCAERCWALANVVLVARCLRLCLYLYVRVIVCVCMYVCLYVTHAQTTRILIGRRLSLYVIFIFRLLSSYWWSSSLEERSLSPPTRLTRPAIPSNRSRPTGFTDSPTSEYMSAPISLADYLKEKGTKSPLSSLTDSPLHAYERTSILPLRLSYRQTSIFACIRYLLLYSNVLINC